MSPGDAGSLELDTAARAVQLVADRINEMKRRKDIVEMIMSEQHKADTSSSPSSNNVGKTKSPITENLKFGIGDNFSVFLHRSCKYEQSVSSQESHCIDAISKDRDLTRPLHADVESSLIIISWTTMHSLKSSINSLRPSRLWHINWHGMQSTGSNASKNMAVSSICLQRVLKTFTDHGSPLRLFEKPCSFLLKKWYTLLLHQSQPQKKNLLKCPLPKENKVNLLISNDIPAYLQLFERPGQVIAQRTKLLAELDRRWEEYEAIHAQLVEELPRFLSLVADYFSAKIIPKWVAIQAHVYRVQRDAWSQLTNKKIIDSHITTTDIIQQYHEHMRAVQECLDNVTAIQKIRSEEPRSSVCSSNSSGSSRSNKLVSWQEILVTSGAKRKGKPWKSSGALDALDSHQHRTRSETNLRSILLDTEWIWSQCECCREKKRKHDHNWVE